MQVAPSPIFERDGPDVHSDLKLSVSQALLGGTMKVPGIHEDLSIKVSSLFLLICGLHFHRLK